MVFLAVKYLRGELKDRYEMGRLDTLVGYYRESTLRHHISRGVGYGDVGPLHRGRKTECLL